jgi:alkylation response protein AidB-like acyl-CoA dehydrogenase
MCTGEVSIADWYVKGAIRIISSMTIELDRTDTNVDTDTDTDNDTELTAWAARFGPTLRAHAARHDADGTWVGESFDALRDAGMLTLAVPQELGGMGATIRQVALVQRELARHCGSTALALAMHHHVTAFTAWRWRRGLPGAEATLRKVAGGDTVIASTGGGDFTTPRGTATKVDGGWRVSGTKRFVSQSPVAAVMSTMFTYEDPERGTRVLNMAVPMGDGVTVLDNWDTTGMRGTASNDVLVDDVFVPDERVLADRPYGVVDPPLQVIVSIAMPIIAAVYLGIAEGAAAAAIEAVGPTDDPTRQRLIGLMTTRLRVAGWALDGALAAVGDDPAPSMETVAAVMAAKREVALAGVEVCDLAVDLAGGSAYFRGSPIERAARDIRAAKLHPFSPEATLLHAGRLALGLPCDVA